MSFAYFISPKDKTIHVYIDGKRYIIDDTSENRRLVSRCDINTIKNLQQPQTDNQSTVKSIPDPHAANYQPNSLEIAAFIHQDDELSIFFSDDTVFTIGTSSPNFNEAVRLLNEKQPEKLYELLDKKQSITNNLINNDISEGNIHITNGTVYYKDKPLSSLITTRILRAIEQHLDATPWIRFLNKVYENPSYTVINNLYEFLEFNDMPITPDGDFLAYKKVTQDYKDIYTGKIDNSPGKRVYVERHEVDDDMTKTCAKGLHYCARNYLDSYGTQSGNHITVVVKVNPATVVAIPKDYNNAKIRGHEYTVLRKIGEATTQRIKPIEGLINDDNYPPVIIQIDPETNNVINTFNSISEASNKTHINSSSISKVINGHRKTAGGYKWERRHVSNETYQ